MAGRQPLEELRKRMQKQAAQTRLPQQDQAQAIQAGLAGGASAPPSALQTLQRSVGNRATTGVVRRELDLEEGLDKTGGTLEMSGGTIGQFSSMGGIEGGVYQSGNTNSPGALGGSSGAIIGGAASVYGMGRSAHEARKAGDKKSQLLEGKSDAEKTKIKKEAEYRDANRTHKTQGTNAVQSAGNVVSAGLSATSGFSQVAANAGATSAFAGANNLLGGIGGVVALPVQIVNTLRTARKAYKQYQRLQKLTALWNAKNPNITHEEAKKTLANAKQAATEQGAIVQSLKDEISLVEADINKIEGRITAKKARPSDSTEKSRLTNKLSDLQVALSVAETKKQEIDTDVGKAQQAHDAAADAVNKAGERKEKGEESPDDIRAYAIKKSDAGFTKKIINIVGGALGIGGGIAATVASFAAIGATGVVATAAMATPVGWALAGAAALIGLAMGGYALVRWAKKRYESFKNQDEVDTSGNKTGKKKFTKTQAFFNAINPFKKAPTNQRKHMATRLYKYAKGDLGDANDKDHAQKTLVSLGLDPDELNLATASEDTVVKLIMEKVAS